MGYETLILEKRVFCLDTSMLIPNLPNPVRLGSRLSHFSALEPNLPKDDDDIIQIRRCPFTHRLVHKLTNLLVILRIDNRYRLVTTTRQ